MSTPFLIIFLRYFGILLLFAGYILFQVIAKKKRWLALRNDVFVSLFFTAVYVALYFVVS